MSRKVQFDIIDIAPAPVLPCLERPDDRVIGAVEVLPCMLVLGGIATTHVSAFQAQTEVDPDIAQLQTYDPGAYKRSQGSLFTNPPVQPTHLRVLLRLASVVNSIHSNGTPLR